MISKALRKELRVLADGSVTEWSLFHKRCPDGSHFNDTSNKCMPLPGELQKHVSNAHSMSKGADRGEEEHTAARDIHADVATKLHAAGFSKLGKEHEKLSQRHHEKYKDSLGEAASRRAKR